MTKPSTSPRTDAAAELRPPEHPSASDAPDVQLTRSDKPGTGAAAPGEAAHRDAQLPHERDQHPDSQAGPEAPNTAVGEQAFRDVSHGLVDTDESLRKSSVDRRDGRPAQPADPVKSPRQATLGAEDGAKR